MVAYSLTPASQDDMAWLEQLRRDVYQELFVATWGGWDEARHARHTAQCWERGGIWIIEAHGARVGMIQLLAQDGPSGHPMVEVGEIQIQPHEQNRGIGAQVLADVIARAQSARQNVALAVGLKNERAHRLYRRLGFQETGRTDTHVHMRV